MACIRKRRNRYVIDFHDNQGKRVWKTMPKGSTNAKAKEVLREIEDQLVKGVYLPVKKIPSFQKVAHDWLEYKKPNLRASTWSVYEGHTRNHFHDIAHLPVNRINTSVVEKFITTRHTSGMNIGTLRKIMVTFGQILAYAVRHKYIDYNPIRDAERPRGQGGEKKQRIRVLSPEEINTFLGVVANRKYFSLFMLAIMSGARQGEILGFKWPDVDWQNSQIHVQRTFNNGRWFGVKTEASNRSVDLGPAMITELKKWKLACPQTELDLIFPNEAGNPINHNNMVSRHFNPALEKAGLPQIRFHDLRHTYASILIEQGENIKYIQTQLGHSSPTVTLNIYAHLMKPANQAAACRLENMILNSNGSNLVAEKQKGATASAVTP